MKIIHQSAPRGAYEFLCTWVFGIWLGYVLFDPLTSLAQYPKSLYFPAGFLIKFLPRSVFYLPISYPFLLFLKVAMLLSVACVLLGFYKKWAALCASILLTVFEGIVRSFGHINHPELLMLFSVFMLTIFFFFEDSIDVTNSGISKYGIPIVAVLFMFCFTYCFAGIHRLVSRGFEIYGTNTITFWIIEEGSRSRLLNWHLENLMLNNHWVNLMMKAGFPLVTFCEITAPFCMVFPRFRYAWLAMMIPFHVMVWLFMGIFFWANFALYILFFNFDVFFKKENS